MVSTRIADKNSFVSINKTDILIIKITILMLDGVKRTLTSTAARFHVGTGILPPFVAFACRETR